MRLILPYALWPQSQLTALDFASLSALPFLQHTLSHAACVSRTHTGHEARPSLSMPHEHARAAQLGWPALDGLLPWAAQAAVQTGLAQQGDGSAWGFISLCHWQISHGLVTLTDPADLELDDTTDADIFATMQPFFVEDGLQLHRHLPGVWLVQSPGLATLPTASLDRVMGDDVDAWLVGGELTSQAHPQPVDPKYIATWQRLQNEMQMLLYTHPVNARRRVPVNSFWLHGTGSLPSSPSLNQGACLAPDAARSTATATATATATVTATATADWVAACDALRRAHLMAHPQAWVQAWQRLDALLMHTHAHEWVLCGTHAMHLYRRQATSASVWQSLKRTLSPWLPGASVPLWCSVLTESQASDVASTSKGRA